MPTRTRRSRRTMRAILAAPIAVCGLIACVQPALARTATRQPALARTATTQPTLAQTATAHAGAAPAGDGPAPPGHGPAPADPGAPRPGHAGPARTRAANRAAAVTAARALVVQTPAPADARRLAAEPAGDGHLLAAPPGGPSSRTLIDRHAFYVIDEPLQRMRHYYSRHRPAGARWVGTGSGTGAGLPANLNVTWQWHPGDPGLVSRRTMIDMVALPSRATGIRVDAQVVYRVPRPAGERVPAGIAEVDITRAAPGQMPDLARTVTKPMRVRAIVALIDRLPIVQSGFVACPVQLVGVPVVTFSFRASSTGPALASASEPANVNEPTSACDALTFTTGTRAWPSLLRGARFLHRVDRLVHTRFATATPIPGG